MEHYEEHAVAPKVDTLLGRLWDCKLTVEDRTALHALVRVYLSSAATDEMVATLYGTDCQEYIASLLGAE